jgi:hypothetical protein
MRIFTFSLLSLFPLLVAASSLLEQNPFLPQGFNQQRSTQTVQSAPADRTRYEFRGVVQMGDRTLLSIVESDGGRGTWIAPGQARGGIEVIEYDPSTQTATLIAGGQTVTLRLREATFGAGPAGTGAAPATAAAPSTGGRPNVSTPQAGPLTNQTGRNGSSAGRGSFGGASPGNPSVPTPNPRVRPDLPPAMQTPGAPPPFTPQLPSNLTVPEVPPAVREAMRQQQENAQPEGPVDFEAPRSLRDVMDQERADSQRRTPMLPPGGIPPTPSGTPPPAPRN